MTNSRTLGLDLGTKCGWALRDGNKITSGTWDLTAKKGELPGQRFTNFLNRLQALGAVDEVYYELVARHLGTRAAHVYGGFLAILEHWCSTWGPTPIPHTGIHVGTIKKHATDNGRADKVEMRKAAKAKWPKLKVRTITFDEADALWILDCGISQADSTQ